MDSILLPWYVNRDGVVNVPNLAGVKYEEAVSSLEELGLDPRQAGMRYDDKYPAGVVITQNPSEGAIVKKGRRVYLTVSGGDQLVIVPNLKGKSIRDAKFSLERLGLILGEMEYDFSGDFPENTIKDQSISAGTEIKKKSHISVIISQGKNTNQIVVPDLVGKSLAAAEQLIIQSGFTVGHIIYQQSKILLPNTVVEQSPREGELTTQGYPIDLFVTKIEEQK